jgi:hypothetical protein
MFRFGFLCRIGSSPRDVSFFFGDAVFFIEGSRYVDLILFEEGLDLFSPLVELSFQSMVLLLATANLLFRPPLVMANGGVGSYV